MRKYLCPARTTPPFFLFTSDKLQLDYNKGGFHILRLNGKAEKNHRTIRWFSFHNKIISREIILLQNNYPQATYLNYIIKNRLFHKKKK